MINLLPDSLQAVKECVYDPCGFQVTDLELRPESKEYGACSFRLNGKLMEHRVAKITPTKTGQFVAIWKRNKAGKTCPFDVSDDLDFLLITVCSGQNLGQFVFPKAILTTQGIITGNDKAGKRGIRVYPPWDTVTCEQARKTQRWQAAFFLPINTDGTTDFNVALQLFGEEKPVLKHA